MKVLLVGPLPKDVGGSYTTGICKVVYELSKQKIEGVDFYVSSSNIPQNKARLLCTYPNEYNGYRYLIGALLLDFFCHPLRTYKELMFYKNKIHANPLKYEFYKVNIRNDIRRIKPDLIHVHQATASVFFANNGQNHIPTIHTQHGTAYRGPEDGDNMRDFITSNAKMFDYYTALNKEVEYNLQNVLGVSPDNISIVPNGTDTKVYYYDEEERKKIRNQEGVKDNTTVFITTGGVRRRKGQFDFIRIMDKFKDKNSVYWLLGTGPDVDVIKSYAKEHGMEERIKCFGFTSSKDLYKYLSASDVFVHLSYREGQSLAEMEAYATGIRTILNKEIVGTIAPDINDKSKYFIVDVNNYDLDALESWTKEKIDNRKTRNDLNWTKVASQYKSVYTKVLNRFHKNNKMTVTIYDLIKKK